MLDVFDHLEGDDGPLRFDHFDDCVLQGTVAIPRVRCGCRTANGDLTILDQVRLARGGDAPTQMRGYA